MLRQRFFKAMHDVSSFFIRQIGGSLTNELEAALYHIPASLALSTMIVELSLLMTYLHLSETHGHDVAFCAAWKLQKSPTARITIVLLAHTINNATTYLSEKINQLNLLSNAMTYLKR